MIPKQKLYLIPCIVFFWM